MPQHTNIYGLYDPRKLIDGVVDSIRYVGKADESLRRLRDHVRDSKNGSKYPVHCWIRKLLRAGATPEMMILAEPPIDSWQGAEQNVIDVLRSEGHELLNVKEGGEGWTSEDSRAFWSDPVRSENSRKQLSKAAKKRWRDPVQFAVMMDAIHSPKTKNARLERRRAKEREKYPNYNSEDGVALAQGRLHTYFEARKAKPIERKKRNTKYWTLENRKAFSERMIAGARKAKAERTRLPLTEHFT